MSNSIILIIDIFSILFTIGWCIYLWRKIKSLENRETIPKDRLPNIATMYGVLGTFFGICFALVILTLTDDISTKLLLGSLRFAFFTSVFGMGYAIRLKIRYAEVETENPLEATNNLLQDGFSAWNEKADAVQQTIQEGHANLINETAALRNDLQEFEARVSDEIMRQLTEAMRQLVDSFNAEINAQCAESFRQLNDSAGRLHQLLQASTNQIGQQIAQLDRSIEALHVCDAAMIGFTQQADQFTNFVDRLNAGLDELEERENMLGQLADPVGILVDAIGALGNNASQLSEQFQSIVSAAENAGDALPQIEERLSSAAAAYLQAATDLGNAYQKQSEAAAETLQTSEAAAQRLSAALAQLDDPTGHLAQVISALGDNASQLSGQFQAIASATESANETFPQIEERLRSSADAYLKAATDLGEVYQQQSGVAADALQTAQTAAQQFSGALGQLDGSADRYANIAERLSELLQNIEHIEAQQRGLAEVSESSLALSKELKALTGSASNSKAEIDRMSRAVSSTNGQFSSLNRNISERAAGLNDLEKALEAALTQSLESLGTQLAEISGRFAGNYGELANQLERVAQFMRTIKL